MNYEEMLKNREAVSPQREKMPLGSLCKKQIGRKYRYVIELKPTLSDSIVFCEALRRDQAWSAAHQSPCQVQYTLSSDGKNIVDLELEQGSYQTLSQLLTNDPAIVTGSGYINRLVGSLLDSTAALHADGQCQLCFAPQNILLKKGDDTPMLLCHGSFYTGVNDVKSMYDGMEDFVAPEVMSREGADERSDVYSLGRLIEYLYSTGSMPYEYKQVVKKAVAVNPDDRYNTIEQMKSDLVAKRGIRRSVAGLVAAVVVALLGVWAFMEIVPQTEYVEYVEPAPRENASGNPLDDNYDPDLDLLLGDDSIPLTDEDRMYEAKTEEIFRRRFESATEETMSKIYRANGSKAGSAVRNALMEKLMEQEEVLATEAGIDKGKAEQIAQEIITRIEQQKTEKRGNTGFQRQQNDNNE